PRAGSAGSSPRAALRGRRASQELRLGGPDGRRRAHPDRPRNGDRARTRGPGREGDGGGGSGASTRRTEAVKKVFLTKDCGLRTADSSGNRHRIAFLRLKPFESSVLGPRSSVGARLLLFLIGLSIGSAAFAADSRPPMLKDVGIEQRLGKSLPLDAIFQDEMGRPVR